MPYVDESYDNFFLSYYKILKRLELLNITTKNGKVITYKDLKYAINVMLEKHPSCRWRSERIRSKRYYILIEGYAWLKDVYFQKEKPLIDADVDFFLDRISKYENLLKLESSIDFWNSDMTVRGLSEYFAKGISSIRKAIRNMCNTGYEDYKYYNGFEVVISSQGVEWLCKNIYKHKYLELLERYKMKLTEKYIKAGYPYDEYFERN